MIFFSISHVSTHNKTDFEEQEKLHKFHIKLEQLITTSIVITDVNLKIHYIFILFNIFQKLIIHVIHFHYVHQNLKFAYVGKKLKKKGHSKSVQTD